MSYYCIIALKAIGAACMFFAIGLILPIGLVKHTHELLPVCIIVFVLLSLSLGVCINHISMTIDKIVALILCAYVLGFTLIIIGGMSLHVREYGWHRTNVEGYIKAAFIFGLVFLPLTFPLLWWVVKPLENSRGFDTD
jgi:hypothetical protein